MTNQIQQYNVFTVDDHDKSLPNKAGAFIAGRYWIRLGNTRQHADKKGLTAHIRAMPFSGKLVLRRPKLKRQNPEYKHHENIKYHVFTVTQTDITDDAGNPILNNSGQPVIKKQWTKVGKAWEHIDGDGLLVILTSMPFKGELVFRVPLTKEEEEAIASAEQAII